MARIKKVAKKCGKISRWHARCHGKEYCNKIENLQGGTKNNAVKKWKFCKVVQKIMQLKKLKKIQDENNALKK